MYLLPRPAEEEFSLGYLGRLAHLNQAKSTSTLLRGLATSFGLPSRSGVNLKALAQAAGLHCDDFLRNHTVTPAIVCGQDVSMGLLGDYADALSPDNRNPLQLMEAAGYFCEDCVAEQRTKYGFGYWHRAHQLPGLYWCPWHKSPLFKCNGEYVSKKLPHWNFEVTEPPAPVRNSVDCPLLNRYNRVIMSFLHGSGPIDEFDLLLLLTRTAKKKGINTTIWASEQPFLSDIAFDTIPHWWLRDAINISEKTPGKFFMEIDDAVCAARVGTRVYALAVALLLDGDPPDLSSVRRATAIRCAD